MVQQFPEFDGSFHAEITFSQFSRSFQMYRIRRVYSSSDSLHEKEKHSNAEYCILSRM